MFEKLSSALKNAVSKITSAIFVDKALIDSIVKELQRALLEADVDVQAVFALSEKIREAAKKKSELEKKEQIIKIIHDQLIEILGKEKHELKLEKPSRIKFIGLYGSGKTTTISKIALYYTKRGYKTCMLGLDVHRPAAPEQLEQLAAKVNVPVFIDKTEKNPIKIYEKFEKQLEKFDLVLIDTAGRHSLDKELVKELEELDKKIPSINILVLPGDIGQAAKTQAEEFSKALKVSGVIITRLDGTAKGGGAIAACASTGSHVLFIGTGEKPQDIEVFNPTAFVGRILGMGDLEALMEKVRLSIESEEKQKTMQERLESGKFTMTDLYEQLKTMQGMGPLSKVAEMIPGLGKVKLPENLMQVQEEKMKHWKFAIDSMTPAERENPDLISGSRIARIAKGANIPASDVRDLLKQYKIVKGFIGKGTGGMGKIAKMAKRFGLKI